jgi:two-component system response regulator FlrC
MALTVNRRLMTPLPEAPDLVAQSHAMQDALSAAEDVAALEVPVLILGESGSGKGILARQIHARSSRAEGPFLRVGCAGPAEILERELFGMRAHGWPTSSAPASHVEQARHGTLVLDEVGELSPSLQAKLVRLLDTGTDDETAPALPRLICTSNQDLAARCQAGQLRADLFYRIGVFPVTMPPLRHRREDIPELCARLAIEHAMALGRTPPLVSASALEALGRHGFPGNVRELSNVLHRAVIRARTSIIEACDLVFDANTTVPVAAAPAPASQWQLPLELEALERLAIEEALRRVNGNRTHAARLLGISLRTLRNRLREWREAGRALAGIPDDTDDHEVPNDDARGGS